MTGFYDESGEAAKIARHYGCQNDRVEITPLDFMENIEKVLWHLDEPKVGMGSFSQYMVAKYAAKEVKVILTGHGGDEFFAGYPVFKAIYGRNNLPKLLMHSSIRELMFILYFNCFPLLKKETGYFLPNIYSLRLLRAILKPGIFDSIKNETDIYQELDRLKNGAENEYERLTMTYIKLYLPALFIVEDKISMAFSLESRTPLCDNEMLDFALSVPLSQKLLNFELKHIPRTAMKGELPHHIYDLPKRGFPTPLLYWFKNELREYIRSFILDNLYLINMFKKEEVEKMISAYQRSKINTPFNEIVAHRIWALLNLIVYFKNRANRYYR
jgi:asparagine synthase (glutamine-hydrolysing)